MQRIAAPKGQEIVTTDSFKGQKNIKLLQKKKFNLKKVPFTLEFSMQSLHASVRLMLRSHQTRDTHSGTCVYPTVGGAYSSSAFFSTVY